jgi:hypothetical protein
MPSLIVHIPNRQSCSKEEIINIPSLPSPLIAFTLPFKYVKDDELDSYNLAVSKKFSGLTGSLYRTNYRKTKEKHHRRKLHPL